jgi:uncharacterized protein YndB with AHSA1/START domain
MNDVATDERVLELERLIAAPPERVFELWTEPELLVKWWGPEGYDVPEHALDVRPGGHWRTTMRSPEGKRVTVSGVYRVIEKPRRLVFTWAWDQDDGSRGHETEVTVTFAAAPGGTRLKLVQQTFQSQEVRDRHRHGWTSSFVCLAQAAESAAQ